MTNAFIDEATRLGLRWLGKAGSLPILADNDKRKKLERLLYSSTSAGFKAADTVTKRAFSAPTKTPDTKRAANVTPRGVFDLNPTEDQQAMKEACTALAADVLRDAGQDADEQRHVSNDVRDMAAQLGLTALGVPEELGGIAEEKSARTAVLVYEALSHGDMGQTVSLMSSTSVATALALYGDGTQQAKYLPAFTEDDSTCIASLAFMEPAPLFDPLQPSVRGTRRGDSIMLNGEKSLVVNAENAELFIVSAMINGRAQMVIVEPGTEGLKVADEPTMGVRAANTGRLLMRNVVVSEDNLLGNADSMVDAVRRARLAWSACAAGTAQAVLDQLVPYVKEREAFGEPIAHRQAVAFTIANIALETDAIRLATWRAAALLDTGKECADAVAHARALVARHGNQIASDAVQLLGGHGFVKEYPNERWFRDLQGAAIIEGALLV